MGRQVISILLITTRDFLKHTSVAGLRYLSDFRLTLFERFLWLTLHIFLLISTMFLIKYTFEDFLTNPLVTSLESTTYPIKEVDFPGISICNVNKISKKRAIKYAELM